MKKMNHAVGKRCRCGRGTHRWLVVAILLASISVSVAGYYLPVSVSGFTGTGICVANGTYSYEQKLNGKCVFRKGEHVIIWRGSYWEIFWDGPSVDITIATTSQNCGMLPPPSGWTVTGGCGGSPILSGGTCESTPPAIVSIVRQSPTEQDTTSDTVTFRVTFDEQVLNTSLDGSDFVVSGAAIGTVNSLTYVLNHTVFDVTVTSISGSGELDLDVAPGNDITDNNPITLGANPAIGTEETYNILPDNPVVTNVSVSDALLSDTDNGSTFTVATDFSVEMETDGSADPILSFSPNVDLTLTFDSGSWTDSDTYAATYIVADAEVDEDSVTIDVTGAESAGGSSQTDYNPEHEFEIDTENPTVLSLSPSHAMISDARAGVDTFTYTILFSESMLGIPAANGTSGGTHVGHTIVRKADTWSASSAMNDTLVRTFDVLDANVEVSSIQVEIAHVPTQGFPATDSVGNVLVARVFTDVYDIDTKNPTLLEITPNVSLVSDALVGAGTFAIDYVFSESMLATGRPQTLHRDSGNPVSHTVTYGGESWITTTVPNDTLRYVHDIADANIDVDAVDITVSQVLPLYPTTDLAGNAMVSHTQNGVYSIDTENPTLLSFTTTDSLLSELDMAGSYTQFLLFSESMATGDSPSRGYTPCHAEFLTTATFASHAWWQVNVPNDQYRLTLNVHDLDVECGPMGVMVSGASDEAGNQLVAGSFPAIVSIDTKGPEFADVPADIVVLIAPWKTNATVRWTEPTVQDAFSGVVSLTSTQSPRDSFPLGTTIVTYTARDGEGNESTAAFQVTVEQDANYVELIPRDRGDMGIFVDGGAPPIMDVAAYGQNPFVGGFQIGVEEYIRGGCHICNADGDLLCNRWVIVELYEVTLDAHRETLDRVWGEHVKYNREDCRYSFAIPTAGLHPGLYELYFSIGNNVHSEVRIRIEEPEQP